MKSGFLTNRIRYALLQVHINLTCLLVLFLANITIAQTTYTTTPRSARAVRHSTLGTWTNFTPAALNADDNSYMEYKFAPSWSSSDRLVCSDFDFADIPDNATIDKLFLKIIRFKKGKSEVADANIYFSKYGGDRVMGPNLKKPGYWPSTEGAAYYEENGSSPGNGNPNEPGSYGPYTYTPADIKSPDFNVYIIAYRVGNNNNFYINFEQVQVWIQYTVPATTITSAQKTKPKDNVPVLNQYNRMVFLKDLEPGLYHLTVTNQAGLVLQQSVLKNGAEQNVPLNDRCRGYCILILEGNGKRKTLKTFVQ